MGKIKPKCSKSEVYVSAYKITPDMHPTSAEYCHDCEYRGSYNCDYIGVTGHSRRCPLGWCNKYMKRVTKRHYRFS